MKIATPFEIRVALIGYVSVGKTTILNALLKDKYSQVAMKRTTAGVNLFRISVTSNSDNTKKGGAAIVDNGIDNHSHQQEQSVVSVVGQPSWSINEPRSAESTMQEIVEDNKILRDADSVQEKLFDVEIDEPICEMRKDTNLVLIDIPGINEAGVSSKYKDYVSKKWHTFDCVIIVLDGRQGVNTEEQVELLMLAKTQEQDIPVIIVMNKIDDPDDDEHQVLVEEATSAIETLFDVTSRAEMLQSIVAGNAGSPKLNTQHSPIVVPMSAIHAFTYLAAARLRFDQFREKMDKTLLEKLGKEAYGRQWKRFNEDQKLQKAYEVVQDPDQFKDGVEASKFDQFLAALSFCVGGEDTQEWLIEKQIQVSTKRLTHDLDYVAELKSLYDKGNMFGKPVLEDVKSKFFELQEGSAEHAFNQFTHPQQTHHLAKPMNELIAFSKLARHMGTLEMDKSDIIEAAKLLVLRQIEVLLADYGDREWRSLTRCERMFVLGNMVSMVRHSMFDKNFGAVTRVLLEKKYIDACIETTPKVCPCRTQYSTTSITQNKSLLLHHLVDGKLVPTQQKEFEKQVRFDIVDSPSEPRHMGHLVWLYGDLLDFVDTRADLSRLTSSGHLQKKTAEPLSQFQKEDDVACTQALTPAYSMRFQ